MDLFSSFQEPKDSSPTSWSVSEANGYIRDLFETDFRLRDIEVEGEISNFTRARSGHLYFTLKDDASQMKCVMWRSHAERLHFDPGGGDQVVVRGNISVYEAGGHYQLYATRLQPAGRGDLALAFEQLKQRLADEGLFEQDRKKSLPAFPKKIGIVTSLNAAGLQDILNVLSRRYPIADVLIAPTLVQGASAPAGIVRALQWLDGRSDVDVIIVARGGGSIEDLWAFNDEAVARAVSAAEHPIISGVGHETDFTIIDFVSDLRAPTPSAAAELATQDMSDIARFVLGAKQFLDRHMLGLLTDKKDRVKSLARAVELLGPVYSINSARQTLDFLDQRLDRAIRDSLNNEKQATLLATAKLESVSPLATLARGYAIVRHKNGEVRSSASQLTAGELIEIQLHDGSAAAEIKAVKK
ncbi:MAG: exodeoxyribonuclease VII large subunit [Candidatus Promineifilaceae bacterium]|jgi:exodeoxyribonuclease VII large subunit